MPDQPERKLAVLLHADIVGSTALVRMNEALAHQRIRDAFRRFSETIAAHGGIAHEVRGDALIAEFSRASDALAAATAFQSANAAHMHALADDVRPALRVGIAMGEVVIADNTVTGEGIVLAQRLEQLAEPGGVCIQGAAYETVPRRLPFEFKPLGERDLKGFDEPVRAYAVSQRAGVATPTGPASSGVQAAAPAPSDQLAVVVLPFTNMADSPEQEYFSDGITEDLITELSRYRELLVVARNSAFTYKGKAVNVREVGRTLGVAYVLEGSVRRAGKRVRVTAQLADAVTGNHVWVERYDRDLDDIFAVQDELTRSIVAVLPVRVRQSLVDTADRKPTTDLTAYDLYLRGRWLHERSAGEDHQSLGLLRRAIDIDPRCAQAYAMLAHVHSYSLFSLRFPLPDAEVAGKRYIEQALLYGENNAEIHAVAARLYARCGDHQVARIHAEKALALNRNDVTAISAFAFVLSNCGEQAKAMPWFEDVRRLDPLSPVLWLETLAECQYMLGHYQAAVDLYRGWRKPPLHTFTHLAACHAQLGQMSEAREAVAHYDREKPADADFPRYAAAHCRLCLRPEDAEHWMHGYRKAGLLG